VKKMGLLSILRKVKQRERELRILVLGLDNAGKTTVVKKLKGESVSGISPTLGFDISTMTFGAYTINFWDVGGQSTIRAYWRNYFEATDGIIWVVDSADVSRLAACREELERLLHEERLAGATLLVLANKQDLPTALKSHDIVRHLGLDAHDSAIGHNRHWQVAACSATTITISNGNSNSDINPDKNISDTDLRSSMKWLVDDIGARIFLAE